MERRSIRVINGLIRHLIADGDLYRQAARGVREPGLKAILEESADALAGIADDLRREVRATGATAASSASPLASVRRTFMEASVKLASNPDMAYVRTLEQMERRLLEAFVRLESSSPDRDIAQRHITRLRLLHMDMMQLGGATPR
jgi:uncharacterized protein (TIGR02284 family)